MASLAKPRKIIIMVKAGGPTDAVINELAELLEKDDILVDGGNALFGDTIRREKALRDKGIHFVGSGISGGEEGALKGPSIMPGGSAQSYESLGPILEKISAHVDGDPCCTHIGTDGAGHFVKMVHNGIEYADMQLIAEAYDLLRRGAGMSPAEIAEVFAEWNKGDLDSFLIEITAEVLRQVDAETGKPLVDVIVDAAGMKGTGTWTVQTALTSVSRWPASPKRCSRAGCPRRQTQRAAAAGKLPGPNGTWDVENREGSSRTSGMALYASKIVAYAQGLDEIVAGRRSTAGTSIAGRWPGSGVAAASSGPGS